MDHIINNILISVITCEIVGFIGLIFYSKEIESWHQQLKKPRFYPPGWIILPIRTFLFLIMGIGLSQILNLGIGSKDVFVTVICFGILLFLTLVWSFVFFGMRKIGAAFLIVLLVLLSTVTCVMLFWILSPFASYMLIPYLVWAIYMAISNLGIFIMNMPE